MNNLPTELDDNPVPEPVFTIDLDIETSCEESSPNENIIQLSEISIQTNYQQVLVNNYTHLISSFPNGNTSDTCANLNVYLQQIENISLPQTNYIQNNLPSDIEENTDYYEIHTENSNATETNNFIPIIKYSRHKIEVLDIQEGWERIQPDIIPDYRPFTDNQGLNMSTNSCLPEDFFNDIFDERMFTVMEETNNYTGKKICEILQGRDHFQQIDHHSYRQHARLGTWRDFSSSDIKIFNAHLLVMSSVHKAALHNYWSTRTLSHTPFLGNILGGINFKTYCGIYTFVIQQIIHHPGPQIMIC